MKAAVVPHAGKPSVIAVRSVDDVAPGVDAVLVRVAYAGVNFIDTYQRSGVYDHPMPHIPGAEGSGIIESVGPGVSGWAPGDRVAWAAAPGSYAEFVSVPTSALLRVPESLPLDMAAALPLQGMTAHYLIRSVFPVESGTRVLLTGAAGGVGRIASQLARQQGATVIGTVSSEDKVSSTLVDHPLVVTNWSEVPERVRELVGAVDVIYDGIGKDSFAHTLRCLRARGLMCLFGGASGQVEPLDPQLLNKGGSLYLTRPTLTHYTADPGEREWRWTEISDLAARGELEILIGARVPLEDAARAHEAIESGTTTGKILIDVSSSSQ